MTEALLSTARFWLAFAYSPGPFWTAVMQATPTTSLVFLYRQYLIYFCTGWLGFNSFVLFFTQTVGALSANFSESIFFNAILFWLTGLPIFMAGLLFWAMLGRTVCTPNFVRGMKLR